MSLDVYLYGEPIGQILPAGEFEYRFVYDRDVVARVGPGRAILSNSMPARAEPFSAETTAAFFEGLLPEGPRRNRLARELGIAARDAYTLLAALGRDCPGAVCVVPSGEAPGPAASGEVVWLSDEELEELVRPQPPRFFGAEEEPRMRFALPGRRHKLSLVRDEEGDRWGWPAPGVPSTHIVKPETGEYPEYVANEMFCISVCREIGLPVAAASVEEIGGRPCLVAPRYDRVVGEDGSVARLHCETFCQALGIDPYADPDSEEGRAPAWREVRGFLQAVSCGNEVVSLLTAACCNYMLGNGDAHGRNFALINRRRRTLGDRVGGWRLAPYTDVTSTVVYDDPIHHGLVISDEYQETSYLLELAEVCEECEFELEVMRGLAAVAADRVGRAVETLSTRAKVEGWHEPVIDRIVELAAERSFGLSAEVEF